jgi:hypothetical protein
VQEAGPGRICPLNAPLFLNVEAEEVGISSSFGIQTISGISIGILNIAKTWA